MIQMQAVMSELPTRGGRSKGSDLQAGAFVPFEGFPSRHQMEQGDKQWTHLV